MDELLVTTRLAATGWPSVEAFGLVPLDGDGRGWRAVAVVDRRGDDAHLVALVAADDEVAQRLLDGVCDELRAGGCARLHAHGVETLL